MIFTPSPHLSFRNIKSDTPCFCKPFPLVTFWLRPFPYGHSWRNKDGGLVCVLVRGTVTLVHRYHKPETSYLAGSIKNWSQELKLNHQQLEIQHGTLFFFACVCVCLSVHLPAYYMFGNGSWKISLRFFFSTPPSTFRTIK